VRRKKEEGSVQENQKERRKEMSTYIDNRPLLGNIFNRELLSFNREECTLGTLSSDFGNPASLDDEKTEEDEQE
jgi:hypothetical protein